MQRFGGESRIRTYEDVVSRFTVCPRWPLEYLPEAFEHNTCVVLSGCKYKNCFRVSKLISHLISILFLMYWY
jgi:hypothetical protein